MFEGLDIGEIAVIITLVAGIAKFWRVPKRLDALEQDHKEVMAKIDEVNASLGGRIDEVNASLGKRIDDLGGRIDEVNSRIDGVHNQVTNLYSLLPSIK